MIHEERQQLRQHERNTQDYEVNEERLERTVAEDEGHVIDLFLKEHARQRKTARGVRRKKTRHVTQRE